MIPVLPDASKLDPIVSSFLEALTSAGFRGDIETKQSQRLVASTDNSIYQILPQGIIYPKTSDDVALLLTVLNQDPYTEIKIAPRGGGTGTNGQSLTKYIVVELSRHLNQIDEVNLDEGWAWVQAGVVLDQLNQHTKPHNLFFAPDLSPSNRATIGGMCNTDACGKGSRVYGKTSNHLLELDLVLSDGTKWQSKKITQAELQAISEGKDLSADIHRVVKEVSSNNEDLIKSVFPSLTRFLSGYNVNHVFDDQGNFNLNYLIAGSEGTLAIVTRLKVKLSPIPKCKALVLVKYASFDDSLRAARDLMSVDPAAVETVDDTICSLAQQDPIWNKIGRFFSNPEDKMMKSVNLVEFISEDKNELSAKLEGIEQVLNQCCQEGKAIGFEVAHQEADIAALWSLRKKGVGLLGNRPGNRRPIPFVEDTVVPPEHLADYIKEFRELLDQHGLDYGMFGHVDVGCLHVRPALDMKNPEDEKLIRQISDQVKSLVLKYGGVIWGEHGKGIRSEYMEDFFGAPLMEELKKIKGAFDPTNKLNPGKLVTPACCSDQVLKLDEVPLRGHFDREIKPQVRDEYSGSVNCNGNGACFNFDPQDTMCPSYKFSRDRVHSPKGRAGLMREWLRQVGNSDYDVLQADEDIGKKKIPFDKNSDFSLQVFDAMNGCLSCKACSSTCPIKVDIPEMKARFLNKFYTRYKRPLKDRLIAFGERTHYHLLKTPWIYNLALKLPGFDWIMKHGVGLVNSPKLSSPNYEKQLKTAGFERLEYKDIDYWKSLDLSDVVFVLPDSITAFYEAETMVNIVSFLHKIGLRPVIPEFLESGKGFHVKGFLEEFRQTSQATYPKLKQLMSLGRPILGMDPAITLTYREEYRAYASQDAIPVQLLQEFLCDYLAKKPLRLSYDKDVRLLGHCGETTAHQASGQQWKSIFKSFGIDLGIEKVGCCGMAGAFGHEAEHLEESRGIYKMSWEQKLANRQVEYLVTGGSCRAQVTRFSDRKVLHPLTLLDQLLP